MSKQKHKGVCINCGFMTDVTATRYCRRCYKLEQPFGFNKRKALERDRWQCVKCGHIWFLNVHHINGNKKDNSLENLTTLCVTCHNMERTAPCCMCGKTVNAILFNKKVLCNECSKTREMTRSKINSLIWLVRHKGDYRAEDKLKELGIKYDVIPRNKVDASRIANIPPTQSSTKETTLGVCKRKWMTVEQFEKKFKVKIPRPKETSCGDGSTHPSISVTPTRKETTSYTCPICNLTTKRKPKDIFMRCPRCTHGAVMRKTPKETTSKPMQKKTKSMQKTKSRITNDECKEWLIANLRRLDVDGAGMINFIDTPYAHNQKARLAIQQLYDDHYYNKF